MQTPDTGRFTASYDDEAHRELEQVKAAVFHLESLGIVEFVQAMAPAADVGMPPESQKVMLSSLLT